MGNRRFLRVFRHSVLGALSFPRGGYTCSGTHVQVHHTPIKVSRPMPSGGRKGVTEAKKAAAATANCLKPQYAKDIAVDGSRTRFLCLEGKDNSRYTTTA